MKTRQVRQGDDRKLDAAPPTREQFLLLGAVAYHSGTLWLRELIWWHAEMNCPCIHLARGTTVEIKTVGHLRAMCEMLGIEWKTA